MQRTVPSKRAEFLKIDFDIEDETRETHSHTDMLATRTKTEVATFERGASLVGADCIRVKTGLAETVLV